MSKSKAHQPAPERARRSILATLLVALAVWGALSVVIFIGMRNYPELPGQKVPKPWMLSMFLLFLVAAGLWADIFFRVFYHKLRVAAASLLGIASTGESSVTSIFTTDVQSEWQAEEGTPILKVLALTLFEWLAIVVGIILPIAFLLTSGAVLVAVLSEQLTLQEIKDYLSLS